MRLSPVAVVLALFVLSACAPADLDPALEGGEVSVKGGTDETGPYDVVPQWQKPAKNHDDTWRGSRVVGRGSNVVVAMHHPMVVENCREAMRVTQGHFRTEPGPSVVSATREGARRP